MIYNPALRGGSRDFYIPGYRYRREILKCPEVELDRVWGDILNELMLIRVIAIKAGDAKAVRVDSDATLSIRELISTGSLRVINAYGGYQGKRGQ